MAPNVYLFFGNDEYIVTSQANERVKQLVPPENTALGLETIDGDAKDSEEAVQAIEQCLSAVLTRGMFDGAKVVWLRNVNFLTDTPTGRPDRVKARLNRLAELIAQGLDAATTLVISANGIDKRYAFYKACKKSAELLECSLPEKSYQADRAAAATLQELAAKRGLQMSGDVQGRFLERVGLNTRQMANELDKLSVYLGTRKKVTTDDVHEIVSASRESPAWDLGDAFGQRDLPRALDLTRQLLFQKESPIRLVITIEGRIRELMLYKEGLQRKWVVSGGNYGRGKSSYTWGALPDEAEKVFSEELDRDPRSTHPFRVKLLATQAGKFSRNELRACQDLALATHEKLVSSALPASVALETMLIHMLS